MRICGSVATTIFAKFVNNGFVDALDNCGLFCNFSVWFMVFLFNSGFFESYNKVISDRSTETFDWPGSRVELTSKAFDRIYHAGFLHKLKFYGTLSRRFSLIFSILSNRRSQLYLAVKYLQEFPLLFKAPFSGWLAQLVPFNCSKNSGIIDLRMDGRCPPWWRIIF